MATDNVVPFPGKQHRPPLGAVTAPAGQSLPPDLQAALIQDYRDGMNLYRGTTVIALAVIAWMYWRYVWPQNGPITSRVRELVTGKARPAARPAARAPEPTSLYSQVFSAA